MSLRVGMVIFQENNPSFKWVVFAALWELLRCSNEKWIKNHTETVYLVVFHAEFELQLAKSQKMQWFFSKYALFSKQNRTVYWGGIAVNSRKRYFHIDENASTEQIYALLDVKSADEDDIDNLMNDSDTEFIVKEEITQAAYYTGHSTDYTRG